MSLGTRELFGSSKCASVPVGQAGVPRCSGGCSMGHCSPVAAFLQRCSSRTQAEGLHHGSWCQLFSHLYSFTTGNLCMVTGGANLGRIGVITNRERHPGSFDVVHVKDANGNSFATRLSNIFVIGKVRLRRHKAGGCSPPVGGCWLKQRGLGVFCRQPPCHSGKLQCWHQLWLRSLWHWPLWEGEACVHLGMGTCSRSSPVVFETS